VAPGLKTTVERRRAERRTAEDIGCHSQAVLRPGHDVEIVNVCARGALVRSAARLKPGSRSELQLSGARRLAIRGRIDRARVIRLEPLRYEAAIVFDEELQAAG
jgi:hypothetical protein